MPRVPAALHSATRYLIVGLFNTCAGLGTIYFCLYMGIGAAISNVTGYVVGIALSFTLNKRWTFTDNGQALPQLLRFLLVTGVAYVANLVTVLLLLNAFDTHPYLAQACGVIPYTIIGYLGSRLLVFRSNAA